MSTKRAQPPPGGVSGADGKQQQSAAEAEDAPRKDDRAARPETEAGARELAERHREKLDYLAKN